jgi:hypothetical protein
MKSICGIREWHCNENLPAEFLLTATVRKLIAKLSASIAQSGNDIERG